MALKDKLVNLEDLKAAYDDLKEKIDDMGGFSSVNGTITEPGVTGQIICNKCGHTVEIEFFHSSGSLTKDVTIGTVPAGYRPKTKIAERQSERSTGYGNRLYLDTNGNLINEGFDYTGNGGQMYRFWFLTD